MKTSRLPFALLAFAFLGSFASAAEQKKPISPHETIALEVDGASLSLSYGRPYTKDPHTGEMRKIWGGLVPYGKVWRTGANEATTLLTDKPLIFDGVTVPAGTYTLWTQPEADGTAQLIVNRQTGQWGTKYDEKQDLTRIALKKHELDQPVNQFTMTLDKAPAGGGDVHLSWEQTEYSAHFTVGK